MTENAEYELVMPFICCKSNGGAYEDISFVAGVRLGLLMQKMESDCEEIVTAEPALLVDQIDLACMKYGYVITDKKAWDQAPDEWTFLRIERRHIKDILK